MATKSTDGRSVRVGGWASKPATSKPKKHGGREVEFGQRRVGGKLVRATFNLPSSEAEATVKATRIKTALYVRIKSECGRVWTPSADAAARAIAAGEDEAVIAELVRRAFP